MFGYHGRYLRIDLSGENARHVPLSESVLRRFLGGVGLAAYLMLHEAPSGIDPLSPAAPIHFCLSPLVGTPLTTSAKFAVVAKSPLTNRLNDALSSSHFAIAAKKAGFDALVLTGSCSRPSVVIVDDGRLRVESAANVWGMPAACAIAWARASRARSSDQRASTWCATRPSATRTGTPAGAGWAR